jgi:NAD-dependent SIR2 family protein deacetylase
MNPSIGDGRAMREFHRQWAQRLEKAAGHSNHRVKVRLGDFDAINTHGSMHSVKCVTCGLSGEISIPENAAERTTCPRCAHVPIETWTSRGQAGLVPPETSKVKHPQTVTADSVDEEDAQLEAYLASDTAELSLESKPLVAGEDESEGDEQTERSGQSDVVTDDVE